MMTKRMAATNQELAEAQREHDRLITLHRKVSECEVNTEAGMKAKDDALKRIATERDKVWDNTETLRTRLEVETIAMVAGEDLDMAEPTPAEALSRAV